MSQPTNAPVALDQRTFGRMFLGRQPGERVSGEQLENDRKQYEYFVKKSVDEYFKSQQGAAAQPQFMSLTNDAGRVIDVMVKPDGDPVVVNPQTLNTQQGMFTMRNPTNAAPIIDPRTGQQVMGYAADPSMSGAPAPGIGGAGMTVTNAATAAPAQTPTPSPTPSFVVEATADEIRQRYPNAPANLVPGMTIRLKSGGVIVVK